MAYKKLENRKWKIGAGTLKLETGNWKMENGK
jgi:hypothetical protein